MNLSDVSKFMTENICCCGHKPDSKTGRRHHGPQKTRRMCEKEQPVPVVSEALTERGITSCAVYFLLRDCVTLGTTSQHYSQHGHFRLDKRTHETLTERFGGNLQQMLERKCEFDKNKRHFIINGSVSNEERRL